MNALTSTQNSGMNQSMKDKNSNEKLIKNIMQKSFSKKFWKKPKIIILKTIITII